MSNLTSGEMGKALANLVMAVDFFDEVMAAPKDDQMAVGSDHHDWLDRASRKVADLHRKDQEPCQLTKI